MASHNEDWCRTCLPCQYSKVTRHTVLAPERIPMPDKRFSHVHIDIIGPYKPSNNFRLCLTMVDRFTRWPEAVPIMNTKAETVAKALIHTWISRFGAPDRVITYRGTNFESDLFNHLCRLTGTDRIRTSAYNPRANGMVKRFHRRLKEALKCLD